MNHLGQADPTRTRVTPAFSLPKGAGCAVGEPPDVDYANIRPIPHDIPGLANVVGFSMGMLHGSAVTESGVIFGWGDNSRGQLGDGMPKSGFQFGPIRGMPTAIEVQSAGTYSCMRTAPGEVWCWGGNNATGQLGTLAAPPFPRRVPLPIKAAALHLDPSRACARLADNRYFCWGDGGGCADQSVHAPAPVRNTGPVRQMVRAYGSCFSCVLKATGQVDCTDADGTRRSILQGAVEIAASEGHVCALMMDGTTHCWGNNEEGQLGRTTERPTDDAPAPVIW